MISFWYHVSIIVLLRISVGLGSPTGAPTAACDTMMPSHNSQPSPCPANYVIEANTTQFKANDAILSMHFSNVE